MADAPDQPATEVNQHNARFTHVYAVLRNDAFHSPGTSPLTSVTVVKVFADRMQAEQEVERLNQLQWKRGIEARYWMQVTRYVPTRS